MNELLFFTSGAILKTVRFLADLDRYIDCNFCYGVIVGAFLACKAWALYKVMADGSETFDFC